MSNSLERLKNDLRRLAKRCKNIKYTEGLLLAFLMTGLLTFSQMGVTSPEIKEARQSIDTSISDMKKLFKEAKQENNKLLKQSNLELIQLMEQGDHVVKSPWSSWQFGGNYYYSDWQGTYKGRGDKSEKYPYEGVFTRSADAYERNVSTLSSNYSLLSKSKDPTSASSNARTGLTSTYGLASTDPVTESLVSFEVSAGINPKGIDKQPLNIQAKTANAVTTPDPVRFNPINPNIVIPADPALPQPPTFAVVLGADCNNGCPSSSSTPRQNGTGTKPGNQNVTAFLHYTWSNNSGAEKGYAFKMYAETAGAADYILGTTAPTVSNNEIITDNEIYFNSYNTGTEFPNAVSSSQGDNRNNQYFFIGGSRFIEADNASTNTASPNKIVIPAGKTLNLGGILTLALVSQGDATHQINQGTITDKKEKDDAYIQNMTQDLVIKGPTSDYTIHRSDDGYVGYKVGIALVQEQGTYTGKLINDTGATIDFRGERSIGEYVYLPGRTNSSEMVNKGTISLSGKESYGMKIAATSGADASMTNEGTINIRKNPDGVDKADNSAAMALMADSTVTGGVSLASGKAMNTGTINLTDVQNSIGTYVNIASDITNTGNININSTIAKAATDQPVNIGMRSDTNTNAKSINSGTITLDGSYAIGMLANGAKLTNTGTITTGTAVSNGVGIAGINGAVVENSGAIKITGTGDTSNIGVFLKNNSTGTIGTPGTVAQSVEVSGDNSTGVLVSGGTSSLTMAGGVKVSGNSISGIVADGTSITLSGPATVTVDNAGAVAGEINSKGSYGIVVKGSGGSFTGSGTDVTAKVTTDKSIGLYSEGTLTVNKANITATDGAINFFANNGKIITSGGTTETGQKSLLFYTSGTNANIQVNGTMSATIKGGTTPSTRGTAFYYVAPGATYGTFDTPAIQTYFNTVFGNGGNSTLGNLTLNMEDNSRLFVASNVLMNLSNTAATNLMSGITGAPTISGSNYKTFMLYLSKLVVNQAVDLNNANDAYNQLEIANSSIENANVMTGSQARQVAMAQENGNDPSGNGYLASKVTLTNAAGGTITLTGDESTGIYAKRGQINNDGTITVGKKSTAIYLIDDNNGPASATAAGTVSNNGTINIGEDSTGIYYKAESTGANPGVYGGVSNAGMITSASNNVIGITFESPNASKTFENEAAGTIELNGDNSAGMYATGAGVYSAVNDGTIRMASSASANSPNLAMYTDKSQITLVNNGTITGGDRTVGLYGYGATLGATSNTTVGNGGTAVYSQGGNVTINGGTLTVGTEEAVGVYYLGSGGTITNNASTINIGDTSFGFVNVGSGNTLTSNTANVNLGNDSVYIYTTDGTGSVTNSTNLTASGSRNYGIYSAGTITNSGNMNFGSGIGNVGIYLTAGTASNTGALTIGGSDLNAVDAAGNSKPLYGIGMATTSGSITNASGGTITVTGENSIGMYATGTGNTATNAGTIELNADNTTGIYVTDGATATNSGTIKTGSGSYTNVVGVYLGENTTLNNTSTGIIDIDATNGVGVYLKGGTIANYGTITVSGTGSSETAEFERADTTKSVGGIKLDTSSLTPVITVNGVAVTPTILSTNMTGNPKTVSASSIGLYVDTSGINYTKSIENLSALTSKADLIVGTEITEQTNSKYILITDPNIITPYKNAMDSTNGSVTWTPYSASLTWQATTVLDGNNSLTGLVMAKTPYTNWAGKVATPVDSTDTYNFLDGLEQRYGVEALGTRERTLFQKLNSIGNNEEVLLYQAIDEMMGHQYANVQQRIYGTGRMLDKEITHLTNEWATKSKESNKIKAFGMRDEYNTDTAGIIDYKSDAYGFAYVHEDETVKLGNTTGWYAGAVHNRIRFKDIGNSKENTTMLKAGVFKSTAFDHNGSLKWTISGEGYVARSNMHRKYLVVDKIFEAKSDYNSYGVAIKNEIGKEFRTSERTSIRPYGSLKLEYGRFSDIEEKSGEVRLEVQGNDYYSIRPEVGVEFKYKQPMAVRTTFVTTLGLGYENELGKVGDVGNKARVNYTTADWFNIRGEKDDRKGNFKADLNIGIENQRFGVTLNAGYDTKGENIRGGIGFRAIY